MLINNVPGEECRIAIIEDGKLEELYHERTSIESHVGSIFKGKVVNVEPAIQAAFIDFGLERNGFLHVTDLHPRYFPGQHKEETERVGHKTPHRERPPIQRCLKRGQEILVQVIKEGLGTKGPTVTSYLSIPGRFLVMMPAMERLGVSRKVDDDDARRAMRKILDELNPPEEFGFIIRTAGIGRPKLDLKRDLAYLVRLWKNLEKRMAQPGVGELYTESDLMIRTIRDVYSTDIDRIIVDEPTAAKRASDFLAIASPRAKSNVLYYEDPVPLFHRFNVEAQIETIHARRVPLPGGGSLVIDSTEALVAIDVNSGKMRNSGDAETTAYRTNAEACDEVCRQLRLRDLGGVVVIDLIDMRSSQKRRAIEQRFRDNLKRDRARTKPLPISQFGILEMTRQRMRPALTKSVYNDCHYCHGEGTVKNIDSVVMDVMRRLSLMVGRKEVEKLAVTVSPDVAFPLLNRKRAELVALEQKYNTPIQVRVNPSGGVDFIELLPMDERGNALTIDAMKNLTPPLLKPVESMPVEGADDYLDDEIDETESRATEMERIDDGQTSDDEGGHKDEGGGDIHDHHRGADHGEREELSHEDQGDEPHVRDADDSRRTAGSDAAADGRGPSDESDAGDPQGASPDDRGGIGADGERGGEAGEQGQGGGRRRRRRRGRRGRGSSGGDGQNEGGGDRGQPQPNRPQNQPQGSRPPQQQPRPGQQPPRQGQPPQRGGQQPPRQGQPQSQRGPGGQSGPPQRGPQPPVSRGYSNDPVVPKPLPGNFKPPGNDNDDVPVIDDVDQFDNRGNLIRQEDRQAGGPGGQGGQGGPDGPGDGQPRLGPDGQPLRKRRRRGGRRHRRRREAQQRAEQERLAAGLPPENPQERREREQRQDQEDRAAGMDMSEGDGAEAGDGVTGDDVTTRQEAGGSEAAPPEEIVETSVESDEPEREPEPAGEESSVSDTEPEPEKSPTRRSPIRKKKPSAAAKPAKKIVKKAPRRKPPNRRPPSA
jgi:ribonuclease E